MYGRFAVVALLLAAQTPVQLPFPDADLRRDVAETKSFAYFLGPSHLVSTGKVQMTNWTEDDQFLLYQTKEKDGYAVNVWNRKADRVQKILTRPEPCRIVPHAKGRCLWISYDDDNGGALLRYSYDNGRWESIMTVKGTVDVEPSPTSDAAMITVGDNDPALFYYGRGQTQEIKLPEKTGFRTDFTGGIPMVYTYVSRTQSALLVDPVSGMANATTKIPNVGPATPPLTVNQLRAKLGRNLINGFWLRDFQNEDPLNADTATNFLKALIASDVKGCSLGPGSTMIAYWDRYNVFVREIKSMPESEFTKLYADWEKKTLMDQSKQAALAITIYSADADDMLPLNNGSLESVYPYAKDSSIFDNFQYVLNGQSMGSINNPGGTVMGRISGRYGRAIAYADGHVVWEPRP